MAVPSRLAIKSFRRSCRCEAKSSTPGKSPPQSCWVLRKSTISALLLGLIPVTITCRGCVTARFVYWPTRILTVLTLPPCSVRFSCAIFGRWSNRAIFISRCRRCIELMLVSGCFMPWMRPKNRAYLIASVLKKFVVLPMCSALKASVR